MLPSYVCYALLGLNDRRAAGITVHGLVRRTRRRPGPCWGRCLSVPTFSW